MVVADLHIGIEHELRKGGVAVPSQTKNTEERLVSLVENTDAEELVVLGDVKHNIPSISLQEYRELPGFIKTLSTYVDVTVVKGNHDGNLEKLVPQVDILDSLERGRALFVHGHSWIKTKAINTEIMVMA
ncbi:MAG: metallophosphoesterase, partial [Candidatus Hydrothermarchaeales archaeon]